MSELRILIRDAVRHAVAKAEKPVGVCLSGGIDSSTVASFAPGLPLFTGYYAGDAYDETEYAALIADQRDWYTVEIVPDDFVDCFDPTVDALASLRCGPGAVGQYVVARYAASHGIKTLLTGEGGDELFGGYARQIIVAGQKPPDGYEDYRLPDGYPDSIPGALDYEWAALRQLCSVDERVAGAWGIRVVPPLLDPWVVAWAHQRFSSERIGKKLLKAAMRGVVPDAILDRTDKVGFAAPFVEWAQEEPVRSFVEGRIGYVPDPAKPWDRSWWYAMQDADRDAPRLAVAA